MTMSATSLRAPDPSPQVRPRVLVADDSRVIRMAIKRILGEEYELIEVGDGASAWDRVREDADIQALVTDIEMPNVDGYELICRMRGSEQARLREMPVIAITGAEDEATKQRAFACGATDFIIKPIDAIQLRARVQAYVRYDQAARELTEKSAILEDQSIVDTMTGLCSRRYLSQRGEQDLAFAVRRGNDLSLIRVDIDNFKKLYKAHGDDISEALLTWFAKLFLGTARTEDTVARVGGAQFAILAVATGIDAATRLCQRLQEAVASKPFRHGNLTIPITLSIGMASLAQDRRDNIEGLLKLAQQRLSHAQSEGGDRVCSSVLADVQVIEEIVAPAVEPPADFLSSLPDSVPEPAYDVSPGVTAPAEIVQQEAEFTLDLIGISDLGLEPTADVPPSALEPLAEPAMELAWIDETDSAQQFLSPASPDAPAPLGMESLSSDDAPLSIDQALHQLAQGQTDMLAPFLDKLMQKIQPLLDFSAQVRRNNPARHAGRKP